MAPANPGTRKNADRLRGSGEVPAVVGIGASADGLEALRAFFAAMPRSPGLAFVIGSHVDSKHERLTPELLATSTTLVIESACDHQPLVRDHVYVIPPDHTLTIEKGRFRVQRPKDRRALRGTINRLFRSLAADQGAQAAAVVLSGVEAGSASGIRAVKAEGGLVIAQSPDTAAHPDMPAGAIATGLVDLVLEPGQMPEALVAHVRGGGASELPAVDDDLTNPLLGTDVATVFADLELRMRRFTAAASLLFQLQPSDTGRPLEHIASAVVGVDLHAAARAVLEHAAPVVHHVTSREGRDYILRVVPTLDASGRLQGVVLTMVDVSDLKRTERELRAAHEQTSLELRRMRRLHEASTRLGGPGDLPDALQEILRATTEITGAEMGYIHRSDDIGLAIAAQIGFPSAFLDFIARVGADVEAASRAAMMTGQRVLIEDLTDSRIFAASPSLPVLLDAGVRAMQSTPVFDRSGAFLGTVSTHYRAPHRFDEGERHWLDLLARLAGDTLHRLQSDAMSSLATDALEQQVADRTKWLALMHQVTGAVNDSATWYGGLRTAVERICETEHWQAGYVYLPDRTDPDALTPTIGHLRDLQLRPFHLAVQQWRFRRGEFLPGMVFDDGRPRWVNGKEEVLRHLPVRGDAAERANLQAVVTLPVRSGRDVIAVLQLFSTEPHAPSELLFNLMNDIGALIGKLLERERSTAEMADLVWREQQGLLHNLHDSLGQTLTGLGMLAAGLRREAPTVKSATQIGHLAQQAIAQVRQFARGLFPFEINAKGLVPALRELASTTEMFHPVHVTVEGGGGVAISDGRVATQLYRIAQEAVTNAVKHAKADSIRIDLRSEPDVMRLQVTDDGVGITGRASQREGLGLRIMMSRAVSIGATLSIEPNTARGTTVSCTLRQTASPIGPAANSTPAPQ